MEQHAADVDMVRRQLRMRADTAAPIARTSNMAKLSIRESAHQRKIGPRASWCVAARCVSARCSCVYTCACMCARGGRWLAQLALSTHDAAKTPSIKSAAAAGAPTLSARTRAARRHGPVRTRCSGRRFDCLRSTGMRTHTCGSGRMHGSSADCLQRWSSPIRSCSRISCTVVSLRSICGVCHAAGMSSGRAPKWHAVRRRVQHVERALQ